MQVGRFRISSAALLMAHGVARCCLLPSDGGKDARRNDECGKHRQHGKQYFPDHLPSFYRQQTLPLEDFRRVRLVPAAMRMMVVMMPAAAALMFIVVHSHMF